MQHETIAAIATPSGRGGVGIVRVSGVKAASIATAITKKSLKPRYAHYLPFYDDTDLVLDHGIALYFEGPNSFTGEDVLELQGHGGPVVLDLLLQQVVKLGARLAHPGEFSERAFLNDKLDLAQAEAVADLIDAATVQAARSALRSLEGDFSKRIHQLVELLIELRLYVEAAIDFPEEEIDFLSDGKVANDLQHIMGSLAHLLSEARQGSILREGMRVVIAGKPNAGKSSLLNALAGKESAIVTDIPGTTRDVLREQITIDGMPLHIIDTAGLRVATDKVEQIGIERAWQEIEQADRILMVVDSLESNETHPDNIWPEFMQRIPEGIGVTVIRNKADLSQLPIEQSHQEDAEVFTLSAKNADGIDLLRQHLKACVGYEGGVEGGFMARRRHLKALEMASQHLCHGSEQLHAFAAGELLAEDLRMAQQCLSEITGEFSSDDLLGRIFSSFCIGK
jgi:tRNA modification GTPase